MKVNVEAVMKTLDGEPIKQGDKSLTLGRVAAEALTANIPDDKPSGEEKVKRFVLATKMLESKDGLPIDITPEEATMAKDLIGKAFSTLIVGQALPLLNGE